MFSQDIFSTRKMVPPERHAQQELLQHRQTLLACYRKNRQRLAPEALTLSLLEYCHHIGDVHFIKAVIALDQSLWKSAIRHFEACLNHEEEDATSYLLLANTLMKLRRPFQAVNLLRKANTLCHNHHRINNLLGVALRHIGKHREAGMAFLEALRLKPHFLPALTNLSLLYQDANDHMTAVRYLKTILFVTRQKAPTMRKIGYCYLQLGDITKALFWYRKAVMF